MTPAWMVEAASQQGVREIPGAPTAPKISKWLADLKAWWTDDETPWCGVFVAHCMQSVGIKPPKAWYRAKGWLDWGTPMAHPAVGCVVIFERDGGGHVGLVVGRAAETNCLMVLGGNQGDAVRVSAFDPRRAVGFRWPSPGAGIPPAPPAGPLPVIRGPYAVSRNEA